MTPKEPPKKLPSFQFYPGDWMKDAALRSCSLFARGLLADLLCLCFDGAWRGTLVFPDGTPWSNDDIANAISGGSREEILLALDELERKGVVKRLTSGALYSKRMVEDEDKRQKLKQNGSKGGSKSQANRKANSQAKPNTSSSSSSSTSVPKGLRPLEPYPDPFQEFWKAYPRKVKKKTTFAAWTKALDFAALSDNKNQDESTEDFLIRRAVNYGEMTANIEPKYIPHPTTWLNGGGWDDEAHDPFS